MAHYVSRTVILDSNQKAVVHFTFISDGVSADFNKLVILDPLTDLIQPAGNEIDQPSPMRQQPSFAVLEFWFNFQGFSGLWQYDNGVNPQTIWQLSQTSGDSHYDFTSVTGIKDRTGPYGTGRIILTTQGFGPVTSFGDATPYVPTGNLLVVIKKYYSPRYATVAPLDKVTNAPSLNSPGAIGIAPNTFIFP